MSLSPEERRRRAVNLCRRLAADIAAAAPADLAHSSAWPDLASTSDAFMDTLHEWEHERATAADVRVAYDTCLAAWQQAAADYHPTQHPEMAR
jgi:hypothetical protein